PKTVREIKDALLNEYEVEPARLEQDLLALLNDLAGKGLIETE
ncbi:MAG: PqqD family protein, partial [Candidatus Omnitrophica bacterium CG07_land_8_20_14_0_80_50_8]